MLLFWYILASNNLEGVFLLEHVPFVLARENHDLAVRQVAKTLVLKNLQNEVQHFLVLACWVLRDLVPNDAPEAIGLTDCAAIC